MTDTSSTQALFERFLRGELSQEQAVDALLATLRAQKAAGAPQAELSITKPAGLVLSAADHARAEALLAAIDRRVSAA